MKVIEIDEAALAITQQASSTENYLFPFLPPFEGKIRTNKRSKRNSDKSMFDENHR